MSEIEGTEAFPAQLEAPPVPERRRREVDSYPTDIPIALASALLAASAFFPWYTGPEGFGISVNGWESGTLGPAIVFLAGGSLALVLLRRLRVHVTLPVEESLAHEAVGWISLVAAVVKSRIRPTLAELVLTTSNRVFITIGAAAVLIVLAGRMSPRAPLVLQPGWHRGRAGTVGLLVLIIVIAGAAVFGATNSPTLTADSRLNPDAFRGTVRGRVPDCAREFPHPTGLTPQYGFDTGSSCQALLSSSQAPAPLVEAFRKTLAAARWKFTEDERAPGSVVFTITGPRCAILAVVPAEGGASVALAFTPCSSPSPTAS